MASQVASAVALMSALLRHLPAAYDCVWRQQHFGWFFTRLRLI